MTTTLWAAPRIGYLLTAALAGGRYAEAAARWRELDEPAQSDVIQALGAQARLAVREAGRPLTIDFSELTCTSCPDALGAAQSAYEGSGSGAFPPCPHCRELVASVLAQIQVEAEVRAGIPPSDVDLNCQGKAVGGAA
jgi:hypothetical protein